MPNDLPNDPTVMSVDFSEMPMMYVNISGDYDLDQLKAFAEKAEDKIEGMKEITRVDLVGALDKELQIDVNMHDLQSAQLTFGDIERAIAYENMIISGGTVNMAGMIRTVRVVGEFEKPEDAANIIVKSMRGSPIYLKDVAKVRYAHAEQESYARLGGQPVITLNVIRKSGENLVESSDKVREIMEDLQEGAYPADLTVSITGDQSTKTRTTLNELINSIVIGFLLVAIVLMFFMGVTNAMFVGLSVPLSIFLTFLILPAMDFSLNMIVLFAFLFALGIVVDNAIVVIENTYRIYHNEDLEMVPAAKKAAGEVVFPVIGGTLTTLAPFVPLAFWPGIMGEFLFYLPVTLILTLTASFLVAFVINPVFAVYFMRKFPPAAEGASWTRKNRSFVWSVAIFGGLGAMLLLAGLGTGPIDGMSAEQIIEAQGSRSTRIGIGNFFLFMAGFITFNKFILSKVIAGFQNKVLPALMRGYEKIIRWSVQGHWKPFAVLGGAILALVISIGVFSASKPKVTFFPEGDPNFVNVFIELPIGTHQTYTDSITREVEGKVFSIVGRENPIVESVISRVTIGASQDQMDRTPSPHKGIVQIAFVEFSKREGVSTKDLLDKVRKEVRNMPGVRIAVDQESAGPPTGKPINIEVSGEDLYELAAMSEDFISYVNSLKIDGIEGLQSDLQAKKPEIIVNIDRERANRYGISTGMIGGEIRTAIYGKEVSKYRDGEDQNPIQLRYAYEQRNNIDDILNLKITFRDMAMGGQIRQIPLSSVASVEYKNSFAAIKRKNLDRVVTISSNVLSGGNANQIVSEIKKSIPGFKGLKAGYEIKMTGEQEDQAETQAFLGSAMLTALILIVLILVWQFNSITKALIVITQVFLSIVGVLLGYGLTGMDFVIVMTGMGIVGLAGIVVNNGILIIEFCDVKQQEGYPLREAIIEAGKTRLIPVLLTATSTVLGLMAMAVGFNIDFVSLFTELDPKIFFGGDSTSFWAPLSWTIIFGLGFATFLTLVVVPVMYLMTESFKKRVKKKMPNAFLADKL